MADNIRHIALLEASKHKANRYYRKDNLVSSFFGENVFTLDKMCKYLSEESYSAAIKAIKEKKQVTLEQDRKSVV